MTTELPIGGSMMDPSGYCASSQRHGANQDRTNSNLSAAGKGLAIRHSPSAGAKLGHSHSRAKAEAAHANGRKGGRPVGS